MLKNTDRELILDFLKPQLDSALIPPVVRKNPPKYYWPQVDDYTMSCGITQTKGGRLYTAWFAGEDGERAVLLVAKSDDDGKTFSDPLYIVDPGYAACGMHISALVGNIWTAPDGRLFLFFTVSLGAYDGRSGSWYAVCENPDDDDPVWGSAKRIGDGASLNKPTVLSDGTWLLPVSLWRREIIMLGAASESVFHELDEDRKAWVYESKDQGKNWKRIGGIRNIFPTFDEHMILERKDGSLLMYLRNLCGVTFSESFDRGRTWSVPKKIEKATASARFFLSRLKSGNVIFICYDCPFDPSSRAYLTAYLSRDDGRTWEGGLLLDERYDVSYPDGFQADDGRIYIHYDWKREKGAIMLAVFREEDILAGKAVSPDTRLKQTIISTWSAREEAEKQKAIRAWNARSK